MALQQIIQEIAVYAPPFLLALTAHEYAHGYVAFRFGDPTAYSQGRLTMNPLKHLDPWGVLAFFIMKIGWAKPVPVNPNYFRDPVRQMLWVALAGPLMNLSLALASGILIKGLLLVAPLIPEFFFWPLAQMLVASVWINVMLAVFNLIPIPPLDGSRILVRFLSASQARLFARAEPFGFLILLALFYTGFLPRLIRPIIAFANSMIIG